MILDYSSRSRRKLQPWMLWVFAAIMGGGIAAILSLDFLRESQVAVEIGTAATEQVTAPQQKSYVSTVLTEAERERVSGNIATVYTPIDRTIGRAQVDLLQLVFTFLNETRVDPYLADSEKAAAMQQVESIEITENVANLLVSLSDNALTNIETEAEDIVETLMVGEIAENSLENVRQSVPGRIGFRFTRDQETVLEALTPQFIVPNTFADLNATESARQAARDGVEPQTRQIYKSEVILREGETVTPASYEALQELGLLQRDASLWEAIRNALVALTAVGLLFLYFRRFGRADYNRRRYMLLLTLLVLSFVLAAELLVPPQNEWSYLFPAAALAILVSTVFDVRLAGMVTLIMAGVIGYAAGGSLEFTFYTAVGSLIAAYTLRDAQRINDLFRAGLIAIIGNLLVMTIFNVGGESTFVEVGMLAGLGVLNGIFSAGLAIIGFYLIGNLFGIVTMIQLQDLSRFDHPLLKNMLHKAPGTYHHSTMVMQLAETAANNVNANSLLCRVGALYHDVGKMEHAPWFSENQSGVNLHDSADPYSSAEIIIGHVTEGLRMGQKYRLPERILDFIAEHHGDQRLGYFYQKAIDAADADNEEEAIELVDVSHFHYPGPRPRSRETGIVMMADAVEATSKAVEPNNEAAIEKLVRKIIDDLMAHDQLDDSGLSLGDIRAIRESFEETLKGRFHVRVKYAGNDELIAVNTPTEEQLDTL